MGKRVMFVEDDRSLTVLYRRVFSRLGYEVCLATDGPQALEAVKQTPPDLVVVDVKLPGEINGLDLLGKILLVHRVPSVINTAYARFQENFRSWCADAYVVKSSDLTELTDAVSRLLAEDEKVSPGERQPKAIPVGAAT